VKRLADEAVSYGPAGEFSVECKLLALQYSSVSQKQFTKQPSNCWADRILADRFIS
jgi:hypothetical protein